MIHNDKKTEQAKTYVKPMLEKRAKLTDVAEGIPVVVSGIVLNGN